MITTLILFSAILLCVITLMVLSPQIRKIGLVFISFWGGVLGAVLWVPALRKIVLTLGIAWAVVAVLVGYKAEIIDGFKVTKGFVDAYQQAKSEAEAATEELNRKVQALAAYHQQVEAKERDLKTRESEAHNREASLKEVQAAQERTAQLLTSKLAEASERIVQNKPVAAQTAVYETPAPTYSPQASVPTETPVAKYSWITPPAVKSDAVQRAEHDALVLVSQLFEDHDGNNWDQTIAGRQGGLYEDLVQYYGKTTSRANVVSDKQRYFERWPARTYAYDQINSTCSDTNWQCRVYGTVSFDVANQSQRVTGKASFEYVLHYHQYNYGNELRITSEGGKVLTRQASALQQQAAVVPAQQLEMPELFKLFLPH